MGFSLVFLVCNRKFFTRLTHEIGETEKEIFTSLSKERAKIFSVYRSRVCGEYSADLMFIDALPSFSVLILDFSI